MYTSRIFDHWWTLSSLVLAVVNCAAGNTGVHASSPIRLLVRSRHVLRSGPARSYGSSIVSLLGSVHSSPQWLRPFTSPLTVQEGSLLSTVSSAVIVCRLFDGTQSYPCEMIPH